ncbi:hypothetical protein ACFPZ0_17650 [Streptomonospora nanhaiensis]|uniref:Uncharacterized protein n=1 Tax=Streptomonospora nanhaiensis TaxID=1323731 RepID=A0A853BLY3_9ACTN|nr:hypothetical protein [Streptomonospora nanhaiensis]MBV2363228.1 hypothetical protein [Streptomonospora nanhaiensis]MBX9389915.1 hypothetical protein [Streptomonospora nanhaiensis]NYI95586.1 hypothetical protein [Streptomonospora nanhaiensis]
MAATRTASASTVALLADIPGTGHLGPVRAPRFPVVGDPREGCLPLLDFAAAEISQGRKIVAVYPSWRAEPAERAIGFVRAALLTDHIAGVPVELAPLPLSLVTDQLAYLAPHLPAGLVAALARELPRRVLAGAWLRTLGSFADLPTSLGRHLASYAPGTSFLAYCSPWPQVDRFHRGEPEPPPMVPDSPVGILSAPSGHAAADIVADHLAPLLRPSQTASAPAQPLATRYWKSHHLVEFAVFSVHPQALSRAVEAVATTPCTWCGEPVAVRRCPFCAAANTPPPRVRPRRSAARSGTPTDPAFASPAPPFPERPHPAEPAPPAPVMTVPRPRQEPAAPVTAAALASQPAPAPDTSPDPDAGWRATPGRRAGSGPERNPVPAPVPASDGEPDGPAAPDADTPAPAAAAPPPPTASRPGPAPTAPPARAPRPVAVFHEPPASLPVAPNGRRPGHPLRAPTNN